MLGSMRLFAPARVHLPGRTVRSAALLPSWLAVALAVAVWAAVWAAPLASGQSCTTQAKMTAAQRAGIGEAAFGLASAVQRGDAAAVQAATLPQYASNPSQAAYLVHSTSAALSGDTLAITQVYLLDAGSRSASDTAPAEFSCPLAGSAAETDFAIPGLPAGRYAFVMVEASGPHPWLLSFLLQSEANGWKMAGFYPHAREAAGHNGLWYWTTARADAKAGKPWLAWVLYGEADQLLRPANFVSSTNLDRLRSETHNTAPPALSDGLSETTPLVLAGTGGAEFRITGLSSEASGDGGQLNLVVHLRADSVADANAATARNMAAATALLAAHPELRSGLDNLWVIADAPGANPFVTEKPMTQIPAAH